MPDKNGFPHFMLKEIFDQPQGLRDTIAPRISAQDGEVHLAEEVRIGVDELRALLRINIVASGTSRHAGMAGQYMFQDLAHLPVDVDYASEFEYRNPMIGRSELTIVITQSGETADTTAAQREARKKGSRTIAISNVVGSTIAREVDAGIYLHAGPETHRLDQGIYKANQCYFCLGLPRARSRHFRRPPRTNGSKNCWRCRQKLKPC
jgi:glucosamine--fructose-6-phosphate aminotransferase (isomerizing)